MRYMRTIFTLEEGEKRALKMFLSSIDAKYLVLLVHVLVSLATAKQGQKRICDTAFTISSDYDTSHGSTDMDGNGNNHDRSLSPWTWRPNISSHRVPRVIFEAQCNTEHCLSPDTDVDERLNSVPIYQDILVLEQDAEDRKCFRVAFEKIVVGCTCVWAKTS